MLLRWRYSSLVADAVTIKFKLVPYVPVFDEFNNSKIFGSKFKGWLVLFSFHRLIGSHGNEKLRLGWLLLRCECEAIVLTISTEPQRRSKGALLK